MNKIILSIEEALLHFVEIGTPDAESLLETYNKRGRFVSKNSYNSLLKNGLTAYHEAEYMKNEKELELKGKNKKLILQNPKNEISKKENKSKGNQFSKKENEIIKNYVFQRLIEMNQDYKNKKLPISIWNDAIEIFPLWEVSMKELHSLYKDYYFSNEAIRVSRRVYGDIERTVMNTLELSFKHLEDENKIKRKHGYFKKLGNEKEEITKEEYELIQSDIRHIVENEEMKFSVYIAMKMDSIKTSDQFTTVSKAVKEMLRNKYNADMTYTAYSIDVLSFSIGDESLSEQAKQALFDKMIKLARNSYKKNINSISGFVEKEFKAFNLFLALHKIVLIEGLEKDLVETEPTKAEIERVQNIKKDYAIAKAEEEKILNTAF